MKKVTLKKGTHALEISMDYAAPCGSFQRWQVKVFTKGVKAPFCGYFETAGSRYPAQSYCFNQDFAGLPSQQIEFLFGKANVRALGFRFAARGVKNPILALVRGLETKKKMQSRYEAELRQALKTKTEAFQRLTPSYSAETHTGTEGIQCRISDHLIEMNQYFGGDSELIHEAFCLNEEVENLFGTP